VANHLYAIHDPSRDWPGIIRDAGMTGWAVISEGIGDDPTNRSGEDYTWLAGYGVTPIVRLNYSHHGEGTIPLPNRYNAFAERCANFVTASAGCRHWIIGNEPNIRAERYADVPITPASFAECFNKCRLQIKHRSVQHNVMPAAVAPYNDETGWCLDYWHDMLSAIVMTDGGADGLAVHTYSRGPDPASIVSEDKMQGEYSDYYNGFRAYRDFLALVPAVMRALPTYITETDQLEPWADANSGWVEEAYAEINEWNGRQGHQKIYCLALYRWLKHDQWYIDGKNGVINDFRDALRRGYTIPELPTVPMPPYPNPEPPEPRPPTTTPEPEPTRDIDPRLIARGVHFDFVHPPAGTGYWRITDALWLDEAEADAVGPDHHILGTIKRANQEVAGVLMVVNWPNGSARVISKGDQAYATYNYDWPMSASLNEFSIKVDDGAPSDAAHGIGMGKGGNPGIHTSTWIEYEWTISEGVTAPVPPFPPRPEPAGELEHPLPGSVITQHWGENAANYARFGMWGHNGVDLGNRPLRTPVRSIAAGIVAYSDFDAAYGHYVRVDHPALGCYSMYCHLDEPGALEGIRLEAGATVGLLGTSGNSSGVHLHLEIRLHNQDGTYREDCPMPKGRVDPQTWCILHGLKL